MSAPHEVLFCAGKNPNAWDGDALELNGWEYVLEPPPPGPAPAPGLLLVEDIAFQGDIGRLALRGGHREPSFAIAHELKFVGPIPYLTAAFFGDETQTDLSDPGLVGSQHVLELASTPANHLTFAAEYGPGGSIYEIDHLKIDTYSYSYQPGSPPRLSFGCMGRRWANNSSINDATTFDRSLWSIPSWWHRGGARDHDAAYVYMNAQDDEALSSAHPICVDSLELKLARSLKAPVTIGSHPYRSEPYAPAPGWIGTVAFTRNNPQDTLLEDAAYSGDLYKLQFRVRGDLLTGAITTRRTWVTALPQAQINSYQLENGGTAERVGMELTAATADVAGMGSRHAPHLVVRSEDTNAWT